MGGLQMTSNFIGSPLYKLIKELKGKDMKPHLWLYTTSPSERSTANHFWACCESRSHKGFAMCLGYTPERAYKNWMALHGPNTP
jgi:hypothetical protein